MRRLTGAQLATFVECMVVRTAVVVHVFFSHRARAHASSQPARARMHYACGFWMTVGSDHALYTLLTAVRDAYAHDLRDGTKEGYMD